MFSDFALSFLATVASNWGPEKIRSVAQGVSRESGFEPKAS